MITCGKCSIQNPAGSRFCKKCGADLSIWKPGSSAPSPTSAPPAAASASGKVSAADLQKAKADATRFEGEAKDLRARLTLSEQQVQKLQGDLATAPNAQAFAKAQSDLATANARITQLGQEINAKGVEVTRLTQDLQRQGGASADLAQALRDLTGARDQVRALQADVQRLSSQLTAEGQRADQAETQRQNAQAEVQRLTRAEQTLGRRVNDLEAEIVQLRKPTIDWRNLMQNQYFKYGAGAFGSFVMFIITWVVFGFGVALPLAFLVGQVLVIYKAEWALGNRGPTAIGWGVLMGPAFLLTVGMWIQIGGAPLISWPVMNLYALVLPAAVFVRARKP